MDSAFRMLIANFYALPGGPAVSGRIDSGAVTVGDSVTVRTRQGEHAVKVMAIQVFGKSLETATADSGPVAITLSGIERGLLNNRDLLYS